MERRILAIETSGRAGSVALGSEDGVLRSASLPGAMRHASELLPGIRELLCQQDWPSATLTDVFVSVGPGSFTGLRIGVSLARTLGWSIGARVVAVPTAHALVRNALEASPVPRYVVTMLDAKRSQVFAAAFEIREGKCVPIVDICLTEPGAFLSRCPRPVAVLGEGVPHYAEVIHQSGARMLDERLWAGRAANVFEVGLELSLVNSYTEASELLPLYVRPPEAEEKWKQLHPEKFGED